MLSKFDFSTLNLLLFRGDMGEYYKVIEKKHPKLKMDIIWILKSAAKTYTISF
jgi:hypothetical protein